MTILNIWVWLEGKKTYGLVILSIIYALSAYFTGHIDFNNAIEIIFTALGGATIRNGMQTNATKTNDKIDAISN